ncbi:hypothetical protein NIES4101_66640 [Calothrix sp. NIES-4101]|nr:hypothetical protein NIES4101_66640 [Calothrix sp. NIES-4101]
MMNLNKLGRSWDISNFILLIAVSGFAISQPAVSFVQDSVENIQDSNTSYSGNINNLFANNSSVGVLAICAAEGNCEIDGTKTSLYYYHVDPGNQKVNRGFCSDQGRGGTNLANADAGCLARTRSRIPRLVRKLENAGVNTEQNVEAFINNLDQWNQASPRVSDAFPKKYADALNKGLKGKEAILWARVEAFRRRDGELEAGNSRVGLFSICANPQNTYYTTRLRQYSAFSDRWRWNCIALDQRRRLNAINQVLARNIK